MSTITQFKTHTIANTFDIHIYVTPNPHQVPLGKLKKSTLFFFVRWIPTPGQKAWEYLEGLIFSSNYSLGWKFLCNVQPYMATLPNLPYLQFHHTCGSLNSMLFFHIFEFCRYWATYSLAQHAISKIQLICVDVTYSSSWIIIFFCMDIPPCIYLHYCQWATKLCLVFSYHKKNFPYEHIGIYLLHMWARVLWEQTWRNETVG